MFVLMKVAVEVPNLLQIVESQRFIEQWFGCAATLF